MYARALLALRTYKDTALALLAVAVTLTVALTALLTVAVLRTPSLRPPWRLPAGHRGFAADGLRCGHPDDFRYALVERCCYCVDFVADFVAYSSVRYSYSYCYRFF